MDMVAFFNKKLAEFIHELIAAFPDLPDFRTLNTTCSWAIQLDPRIPQQTYHMCVYEPYAKKIMAEDESFFLKESFNAYTNVLKNNNIDLNVIDKIKNIWGVLTPDNKQTIWKYLKVLTYLSEKCGNDTSLVSI
jgi:hypothetical protein